MVLEKAIIEERIKKELSVRSSEKEEFGEVFTPPEMIEPLLNEHSAAIWKSKTTTFLDPCAGRGNFPVYIFYKLFASLASSIPNEQKRAEHILETMIFMVELNSENAKATKKIFHDICPTAKINLLQDDFLKLSDKDGFHSNGWPTHFTVVIGNPPYNAGGTKREGQKRLHVAFTENGLYCAEEKGYVSYICPPNYRETDTPMNTLFQEANGHFIHIKIYGSKETFALFHIQGRVDAFIYQKGTKGKTHIQDEYDEVANLVLDLKKHIPNFGATIFEKLYKAVERYGHVEGSRTTELSTIKQATFGCGSNKLLHLITAEGRRIYKTKKKHSLQTTRKLFINGLGLPYVYYDKEGVYGPSQSPIIIQEPSQSTVALMTSSLFQCIAWGLRITGNNNLPYILDAVPLLPGSSKTEASIASLLHLTAKEKTFINDEFPVPISKDADLVEPCGKTRKQKKKTNAKTRRQNIDEDSL